MTFESDNNLFGNVSNPFDETRTAGCVGAAGLMEAAAEFSGFLPDCCAEGRREERHASLLRSRSTAQSVRHRCGASGSSQREKEVAVL